MVKSMDCVHGAVDRAGGVSLAQGASGAAALRSLPGEVGEGEGDEGLTRAWSAAERRHDGDGGCR
jgi:hypothetical protein